MSKNNKKLNFIECVHLIERLVDSGLVQKDPENPNNVLVYREEGTINEEGWYSENILDSVAKELQDDVESQQFLMNELKLEYEDLKVNDFFINFDNLYEVDDGIDM